MTWLYIYVISVFVFFALLIYKMPKMIEEALEVAPMCSIGLATAVLIVTSFIVSWIWPGYLLWYLYNKVFDKIEKRE